MTLLGHYLHARHAGIPRRFAVKLAWRSWRGPTPEMKKARAAYVAALTEWEAAKGERG